MDSEAVKSSPGGRNRRAHSRRPDGRLGYILLDEGKKRVDISLVDISMSGCRARLQRPCDLPERFVIVLSGWLSQHSDGIPCVLKWQREDEAGMRFASL